MPQPTGGGGTPNAWYVIALPPQAHGFPGYATISQKPFPTGATVLSGPYNTRAEALAAVNLPLPKGTPGGSIPAALQSGSSLISEVGAVGDFFHRLTEKTTWVRVGEVVGGGILLFIGVRALAHGSPTVGAGARQSVSKPASKTVKRATKVAKVAVKKTPAFRPPKKPEKPPAQRPPTVRISHIVHHTPDKPPSAKTQSTVKRSATAKPRTTTKKAPVKK